MSPFRGFWTVVTLSGLVFAICFYFPAGSSNDDMAGNRILRRGLSSLSNPYRIAWVTVPDRKVAQKLSDGLVEGQLAACVNTIPGITSTYRWQGKIERDDELLLMVKTKESLVERVIEYVERNHPYDSPEVITTKIEEGRKEYLSWIDENTVNVPDES